MRPFFPPHCETFFLIPSLRDVFHVEAIYPLLTDCLAPLRLLRKLCNLAMTNYTQRRNDEPMQCPIKATRPDKNKVKKNPRKTGI